MALSDILVWIVGFSCLGLIVQFLWIDRGHARGWFYVSVPILLLTFGGVALRWPWMSMAGQAAWGLLVLTPSLLFLIYHRLQVRQRFTAARRVALVIRALHPADGWRELPEMVRALELAQRGDTAAAIGIYRRFQDARGPDALLATAQIYRITNRWDEFMEWRKEQLSEESLAQHPSLIPLVLRGFGEVGDLNGMVAWFESFEKRMERMPLPTRSMCRLLLYAFCGRLAQVERLLPESLAEMPAEAQRFWIATAALASGQAEEARQMLTGLTTTRDHLLRGAVLRRLEAAPVDLDILSDSSLAILTRVEQLQDQEERFARRPGLWRREARATQFLILANVLMFALEMWMGGSTNEQALIRLGAVVSSPPEQGQWWRLGASLFLHYGSLHLLMNLLALAWLGPFAERTLGPARFMALYLLAGVGASSATLLRLLTLAPHGLLVGASGSVMALIGATAAIALRGWIREKARPASRQFIHLLLVIAAQTAFDLLTPQVSLTAHLAGLALGFGIASFLPHRAPRRKAG